MSQRVGSRPEEQSKGGSQFEIQPGRYRVTSVPAGYEFPTGSTPLAGLRLNVIPLGMDWKPTTTEEQSEFLAFGWTENRDEQPLYRVGKADGASDDSDELSIGGSKCLAVDEDAVGNCILHPNGNGARDDLGMAHFTNSAIHHGVSKDLFDGYGPNLVGMEFEATRAPLEKAKKDGRQRTALIIGRKQSVTGATAQELIHKYPDAQTGGGSTTNVKTQTKSKANGVPVAPVAAAAAAANAPAPAAAAAANSSTDDSPFQMEAIQVMSKIGEAVKGKTISRAKVNSRSLTVIATLGLNAEANKGVSALLKDDAWFTEKADELGWTVNGAEVTIPA